MTFEGYIEGQTDRAILFRGHYWSGPDWFPKSQIEILPELDTHEVRILASAWICDKKKIEEFKYREVENEQNKE